VEVSLTLISQKLGYKVVCLYTIYSTANLFWPLQFVARPPALFVNEGPQAQVKICNQS